MKKQTIKLLAVAILGMIAITGSYAQGQTESEKQYAKAQAAYEQTIPLMAEKKFDAALKVLEPVFPKCTPYIVDFGYQIAFAKRDPKVLEWAKVRFLTTGYAYTPDATNNVYSALVLTKGLGTGNAWMKFQETGEGVNPIADVVIPKGLDLADSGEHFVTILRLSLAGQNVEALEYAESQVALVAAEVSRFKTMAKNASAEDRDELMATASAMQDIFNDRVGWVACVIRNITGNMIEANTYVLAMKEGRDYPLDAIKSKAKK